MSGPGEKYPDKTDGRAVFFSPHAGRSFYFKPDNLNWNFSYRDGNSDGRHVVYGTFYYHKEFFSQSPELPIQADFRAEATREDGLLYAHVTFYQPGSQGEHELLGEFFARDPNNDLAGFEGRDDRLTGAWSILHTDTLEERLRRKYEGRESDGDALFYKSGAGQTPSLHLTVEELGWGFLHGGNPPANPGLPGILFYNEGFFDQEDPDPISADFVAEKREEYGKRYVLITFYRPGTGNEEVLGEFLAEDRDDESKDLLNQRKTGQWRRLAGPDLEAELRAKYSDEQVSDALFYKGSEDPPLQSFRVHVYKRNWEFHDSTFAIGHRLPGLLFFNDPILKDSHSEPVEATYRIERKRGKRGYYALVKFYAPGSNRVVWGELLALDLANRAGETGLLDRNLNGEWKNAAYFLLTAVAFKPEDSTTITVRVLEDIAEIECDPEDEIYREAFNVRGELTSKTVGSYGDFVRWHTDRAIFFTDETADSFTSFFFPDDLTQTIGSQNNLEMDVSWTSNEVA